MIPKYLKSVPGGVELAVKVVPSASRDRIAGPLGDALKVQVAAPPERGKANAAVEKLVAERLGVLHKQVHVIRGMTTPRKTVMLTGVTLDVAAERLANS